jgi:hypothetical protein
MRKNAFIPADHIADLNEIKNKFQFLDRPFTFKEISDSFKRVGIPSNDMFWRCFKKSGLVQQVSKGLYMFCFKVPIHVSALVRIYNQYKDNRKVYLKPDEVVQEEPIQEVTEALVPVLTEQSAIDFLKSKGYVVLRCKSCIYEVL